MCQVDEKDEGRRRHADPTPPGVGQVVALLALFVAVTATCAWVFWRSEATASYREQVGDATLEPLRLWVTLVSILAGWAAVTFVVACAWWTRLTRASGPGHRSSWRSLLASVALVGLPVAVLWTLLASTEAGRQSHEALVRALTIAVAAAAVPALATFLRLQSIASSTGLWRGTGSEPFTWMETLRRVSATARRQALLVLVAGDEARIFSNDGALLYGLLFAGILALFYGVSHAAIDYRGRVLIDRLAPLPSADSPTVAAVLERRQALATLSGLGGSLKGNLEAGVIVLAPLITASLDAGLTG